MATECSLRFTGGLHNNNDDAVLLYSHISTLCRNQWLILVIN